MHKPDDWFLGHKSIEKRINVRKELKRLRVDPLEQFLSLITDLENPVILQDEISLYREAYSFYYLSLERFLPEMSIAIRYNKGAYYVRKYGGKYTDYEAKIAKQYNAISRYLELDFFNCLLHARILLDRVICLSRHFLDTQHQRTPSFTSFNQHKKFFKRLASPYGQHEEYAVYIRSQTNWFDMPLKVVRDKFLIHAGKPHVRTFGYPAGDTELSLVLFIPSGNDASKSLSQVKTINVSIPRLYLEIERFLLWFADYGMRSLKPPTSSRFEIPTS